MTTKKRHKPIYRWMLKMKSGYLLCLTYEESELPRLRRGLKCEPPEDRCKLVKVRLTEIA